MISNGPVNTKDVPLIGAGTLAERPQPTINGYVWLVNSGDGMGIYQVVNLAWVQINISAVISAWLTAGNTLVGGEKLGALNDFPVSIVQNNVERIRLPETGATDIALTGATAITGATTITGVTQVSGVAPGAGNYVRMVANVANPYIEIFDNGAQQVYLLLGSGTGLTVSATTSGSTLTNIIAAAGRFTSMILGPASVTYTQGTGSPEGVVSAPVGSIYTSNSGGAGTTLYVKETGAGNTGWVAK